MALSPQNDADLRRFVRKVMDEPGPKVPVPVQTKAGIPSDADYQTVPPVGWPVLDTTNNRIYFRTASATWKYAALT